MPTPPQMADRVLSSVVCGVNQLFVIPFCKIKMLLVCKHSSSIRLMNKFNFVATNQPPNLHKLLKFS